MTHTLFQTTDIKKKHLPSNHVYIYIYGPAFYLANQPFLTAPGYKSTGHEGRGQRAKQFLSTLVEKHPIQLVRDIHHQYPYKKIDI